MKLETQKSEAVSLSKVQYPCLLWDQNSIRPDAYMILPQDDYQDSGRSPPDKSVGTPDLGPFAA